MTQHEVGTWVPATGQPRRRAGRIVFWTLVGLAVVVLITCLAIPIATLQPYLEQSTSMQNSVDPGDRMVAVLGSSGLRRGDVIVLHVPTRISGTDDLFVKRVIGLPGDHVACCDAKGRVTVNGRPLDENYLYPGDPPSRSRFSVTVRHGQLWVMGDHRNISVDSRKWGPVPVSGVVGRIILVTDGSSFTTLRTPQAFVSAGLAPRDTRLDFYVRLAIAAMASVAALVLLACFGIIRFIIRRRRTRRAPPPAPARPRGLVEPIYGMYRAPPGPPRQEVTHADPPGQDVANVNPPGQEATNADPLSQEVTEAEPPGQEVTNADLPAQEVSDAAS
jgi:signal peptidase I